MTDKQKTKRKPNATKDQADASACDTVFGISELLENIVVHLEPKNIFGVLRVSKAFLEVKKSPKIQEKLFLRLQGGPERFWTDRPYEHEGFRPPRPSPFINAENRSRGASYGWGICLEIGSMLLNLKSSVLDTYPSDPLPEEVLASFGFEIGEYKIYSHDCYVTASTWRAAIEEVKSSAKEWCVWWHGRRLRRYEGPMTPVGEKLSELEKETGCEAKLIISDPDRHVLCSQALELPLKVVWFPDNKD